MKFAYIETSAWINAVENDPAFNAIVTTDKHFKNLTVINPYVIELPKLEILK